MKFTNLLTLLFIGCKLTGYITWSWWVVLSPLLVTVVASVALGACVMYLKEEYPEEWSKAVQAVKAHK